MKTRGNLRDSDLSSACSQRRFRRTRWRAREDLGLGAKVKLKFGNPEESAVSASFGWWFLRLWRMVFVCGFLCLFSWFSDA